MNIISILQNPKYQNPNNNDIIQNTPPERIAAPEITTSPETNVKKDLNNSFISEIQTSVL